MSDMILPALLALGMMTGAASAQKRTYYDSSGRRFAEVVLRTS